MRIFWVSVDVRLGTPLVLVGDREGVERARLIGFVQELGCTAEDAGRAEAQVRAHLARYDLGPDQTIEPELDAIEELSAEDLDEELLAKATADPHQPGVWFTTGRSFYSEES